MIDVIPPIFPITEIQKRFFLDNHRFPVCSAGRRSRKTLIGGRKVLHKALIKGNQQFFMGAPTLSQAKGIFWNGQYSGLQRILPRPLIIKESHSDLWVRLPNNSEIHVIGLDKPQRHEGQPWHGGLITEMGDVKAGAWEANIRPLVSDTLGFIILDGVPEGRANDYYGLAVRAAGGTIPTTTPGKGVYAENPAFPEWCFFSWFSADVLTPEEIAAVKLEYDERTYRQEYEGSFEGEEGRAYYAFGIKNIVDDAPVKSGVHVHIGMDFNVDPMTAALCEVEGDTVRQFDEVFLRHSNTYEMADHLKTKKGIDPANATIYPDSTGGAESSNAHMSDLNILKMAGFKIKAHPANPLQRDRLAAVNTRCRATDGTIRYFVQRHCTKTINDLNCVQVLSDGRLDKDQKNQQLTHISDGLGYLIAYLFPVKRKAALASFSSEDFY